MIASHQQLIIHTICGKSHPEVIYLKNLGISERKKTNSGTVQVTKYIKKKVICNLVKRDSSKKSFKK